MLWGRPPLICPHKSSCQEEAQPSSCPLGRTERPHPELPGGSAVISGHRPPLSRLWLMPWRQALWALSLPSLAGLQWARPHHQGQS